MLLAGHVSHVLFHCFHLLVGHSLTVHPPLSPFIIPTEAENFAFNLPDMHTDFWVIFQSTRTILNYNLSSSVLTAHSKLMPSANLRIVLLICVYVSLMKKKELYQIEDSNLENWTQYSPSVWQWIFCKDPLYVAFQPVMPPLVSFGLTMFPGLVTRASGRAR